MINCGPGQVAIWREIRVETAAIIVESAEQYVLGKMSC